MTLFPVLPLLSGTVVAVNVPVIVLLTGSMTVIVTVPLPPVLMVLQVYSG